MYFKGLKGSASRGARLLAFGSMCTAIVAGASVANAVDDDDWMQDCDYSPTCEIIDAEDHYGTPVVIIPECPPFCDRDGSCDDGAICAWVDLPCEGARGMTIKLFGKRPNGEFVLIERKWRRDKDQRQKAYFDLPNFCGFEMGRKLELKLVVIDDETDERTSCEFEIHVVCGKRPDCYFNGEECAEERDMEPMMIYEVATGDIMPVLELCARSRCGERARVELFARPPFMQPIGHRKGSRGQSVCIETKENDVVEGGYAEGTYWAKFKCTDVLSGRYRVMKVGFRYTDPEPDIDPAPLCAESESGADNNNFDDASSFVAGECVDDLGVTLSGMLDTPIFINGDVDYLNVTGLTAGATYRVTVVDGMNSNGSFTDTMLGWFVSDGVAASMDDNSGPLLGYSMLSFVADGAGAATLAVTGHGDTDFDGLMDVSMPYEEYGFGSYELSIALEAPPVESLEARADFNADGIVDTADLGVMIGGLGFTTDLVADLNDDGVVNTSDLGMLISVFGMTN